MINTLINLIMDNKEIVVTIVLAIGIPALLSIKKERELVYSFSSFNFIQGFDSFNELEFTFNNNKIKNFTKTKLIFWNNGRKIINKKDIPKAGPLKIKLSESSYKILSYKILKVNNPANQIKLEYNETNQEITLKFDYLNKNNGAVVEIIHDGKTKKDIKLEGDIKDGTVKNVKKDNPQTDFSTFRATSKLTSRKFLPLAIWAMFGFLIFLVYIYSVYSTSICGLLPFIIIMGLFLGITIDCYTKGVPKGLEEYVQDYMWPDKEKEPENK
jgi:hypothetical protein